VYIIHPLFQKSAETILKCFCHNCYHCLLKPEIYDIYTDWDDLTYKDALTYIDKKKVCRNCQVDIPKVTSVDGEIFFDKKTLENNNKKPAPEHIEKILKILSNISQEELAKMKLEGVHPKNFVISKFPVSPIRARPFTISDGRVCDDTLTVNLIEIIKASKAKNLKKLNCLISTHIDNSQGKNSRNNSMPIKGIKERLSGKGGLIRNNLAGKRTNQSARTVIGPEVNIKTDELLIPSFFARKLTYTEICNEHNKAYLEDLIDRGRANFIIRDGRKYCLAKTLYSMGTRLDRKSTRLNSSH